MMEEFNEKNLDMNKARSEMGQWMADYLDDAGYTTWASHSTMYKSMFMTKEDREREAEKDAKNYAARGIPMNLNWL